MMLSKTLVSFIAAFAIATTVSAAATPMARDGSINASQCNVGSISCCNTVTSASNPFVGSLSGLLSIPLDLTALVGLSCVELPLSSTQCTASPVCCNNVNQYGLINVGCTPVTLGL